MIFRFLRMYFIDSEFEQKNIELAETRAVLKEYKEYLAEIKSDKTNDDSEKVEPDFLTLIWASVGVGIAIFLEAGKKAGELNGKISEFPVYIWVILAVFSLYFVGANGINAVRLTRKYVASKRDPIYRNYAWYLTTGIILLVSAVLAFALLPHSTQ